VTSEIRPGIQSSAKSRVPAARWIDLQAARMERTAACVISLEPDSAITVTHRPDRDLKVVAVLGPAQLAGRSYDRASLLEVGFRRNRPYMASRRATARRRWFSISAEQYERCAPELFHFLQRLVDERVGKWREPQFWLPFRNLYLRRRGYDQNRNRMRLVERGIRIQVDWRDQYLIADMFAFERLCLQDELRGLGRFIDTVLARRPFSRPDFRSSVAWEIISKAMARTSLLPHHRALALTYVDGVRLQKRQADLEVLVGSRLDPSEMKLLPGLATRTHPLQRLRIVRITRRGITVELYPSSRVAP
jgi:hypothetical protein